MIMHDVEITNSRDNSACLSKFPFPNSYLTGFEPSISDYIMRIAKTYAKRGVTIKIRISPNVIQNKLNF